MLFMSKDAKAQLEEYQAISEIVNDQALSVYTKAAKLNELWFRNKSQTARSIVCLLLHHPDMKEGYDRATKAMHEHTANGVHYQYSSAYKDLRRMLYDIYVPEEEKCELHAKYCGTVSDTKSLFEEMRKTWE